MGCGLDAVCVRRVSSFGPVIVRVGRGLPVDFSSTKETRIKKKAPRQLVVFPLLHHGSGSSSPELRQNGDFGHRIQIQVYVEGEEDEGVQFWGLWAWEIEVFHGGRGSRGFGSGSLSWGACWWQREGRARPGVGRGGCGGAHLEGNRTKMARWRRSTSALFFG